MPRTYTIECHGVSVSAVQDILAAYAGSSRTIRILAVQMGAYGQTTVGNYPIRLVRLPATVTTGSGGTAPTPVLADPNNSAASFTARANDMTQASTSGTAVNIWSDEFNPINGFYWQTPARAESPEATPGEAFSLSLDAISGTLTVNATMWVEEQ